MFEPGTRCSEWEEQDFYDVASRSGTDKVTAHNYHRVYQRWLGPLSCASAPPFTFIEIGFASGGGAEAWRRFLPSAEIHEFEIACREDRRERWVLSSPNFALWSAAGGRGPARPGQAPSRIHCGSGVDWAFVHPVLTHAMANGAHSPLGVVVDDGGHSDEESDPARLKRILPAAACAGLSAWADGSPLARTVAKSFFYYFPRLAPRGLFFMEDIDDGLVASHRPDGRNFMNAVVHKLLANDLQFLRAQHTRADPPECFAELRGLLQSISCAQGICVFERTEAAARSLPGHVADAMWQRATELATRRSDEACRDRVVTDASSTRAQV
jgi:hypothetical protein